MMITSICLDCSGCRPQPAYSHEEPPVYCRRCAAASRTQRRTFWKVKKATAAAVAPYS